MKGINIQFDNLVNLLQKNLKNKQSIKNRDTFDLVYQKVTLESLKIISIVFDEILQDFSIKQSYNKLLKQLKQFLSYKPIIAEDQDDDIFNKQFDQVQQFMNSRKPVTQIDNTQRGDIYKFLFQAENKEKDMAQFMGNMNKANSKGSKHFLLSTKKLKTTMKHISIQMQQSCTQTNMTIEHFQKIQKKLPNIFTFQVLKKQSQEQDIKNEQIQKSSLVQFDIQSRINDLINQRIQSLEKKTENDKVSIKKQLQNQKEKKKQENTNDKNKKKINKRNSETNLKRNSNAGSNLKSKSGLLSNQKQAVLTNQNELSNFNKVNNSKNQQSQSTKIRNERSMLEKIVEQSNQQLRSKQYKMPKKRFPPFKNIAEILTGVSQQKIKQIYQNLQTALLQEIKVQTQQKQVNTDNSCLNQCNNNLLNTYNSRKYVNQETNTTDSKKFIETGNKEKIKSIKNKDKPSYSLGTQSSAQNCRDSECQQKETKQKRRRQSYERNNKNVKFKPQIPQNNENYIREIKQDGKDSECNQLSNSSSLLFPQIKKGLDGSQRMNSTIQMKNLRKQGKQSQQSSKKLRDVKLIKSIQNSKYSNKQNYSLDMYKAKKDFLHKSRVSQHLNLPSLNRNAQSKGGISLHEDLNQSNKNLRMKKSSKKYIYYEQSSDLNKTGEGIYRYEHIENNNFGKEKQLKKHKHDKSKDISKEEERIMKQLEKISNQNSIKANIKNIQMYIQFFQSVHHRRCGQKCIHLQRFYEFLHKKNLPNRKQLMLHKADMNINVNL